MTPEAILARARKRLEIPPGLTFNRDACLERIAALKACHTPDKTLLQTLLADITRARGAYLCEANPTKAFTEPDPLRSSSPQSTDIDIACTGRSAPEIPTSLEASLKRGPERIRQPRADSSPFEALLHSADEKPRAKEKGVVGFVRRLVGRK
jgi:hypothetical protein